MSDPAAKETRATAQTVHPLDFQPLSAQQLSVMEVSFSLPQNVQSEPGQLMPRAGRSWGRLSPLAAPECNWLKRRLPARATAQQEIPLDRAGALHKANWPSWMLRTQPGRYRSRFQPRLERTLFPRLVSGCQSAARPTP